MSPRGARAASKQDESCLSWASAEMLLEQPRSPLRGLAARPPPAAGLEVEEAGQAGGPVVVVDVEVGPDRAVCVAGRALRSLAAKAGDAAREHRQGVERDPVVRHPRQAGLTAELDGQVGEVERRLGRPGELDAARRGHGLHADAGDVVAVLQGEPEDRSDLVDVEPGDDGGDQHHAHVGAHDVLVDAQLLVEQRLAAQRQVHVVGHPVELQVQGVQPGVLAAAGEVVVGEAEPVGGHLDVIEAQLAGHLQDLEELRVQRGLAARELDVTAGLGGAIRQGCAASPVRSRGPG